MREFLKNLCETAEKEDYFSGVLRFSRKGQVVFEQAYGYANRSFKVQNRIDTRFDTASITKTFTAVAILQLVEQGALKLDDKITELVDLGETKIPHDVTVEQLLNHTSGIADDADEEAGENYADLFVDSPNYAIRECRDFLKNFAYKEPNFKAGSDVRYCNCSYVLLGMAIEQVTGMPYREYVKKHVFEKADMMQTGFFAMDEINENVAEGYPSVWGEDGKFLGYKKNIYCYPPIGTPDGGAYTTAEDLDRFIHAIREHRLLSEYFSELVQQPHCAFTKKKDWYEIAGLTEQNGYAFEFFQLPDGENFCMYKDGCNDGVAGMLSYYPKEDICLVILSNQDCNVWKMHKKVQLEIFKRF